MESPKISPVSSPPSANPITNEKMSPTARSGMRLISPRTHALRRPKLQATNGNQDADGRTAHAPNKNHIIGMNQGNGLSTCSSCCTSRMLHAIGINMCAARIMPVTSFNHRTRTLSSWSTLASNDSSKEYMMPWSPSQYVEMSASGASMVTP